MSAIGILNRVENDANSLFGTDGLHSNDTSVTKIRHLKADADNLVAELDEDGYLAAKQSDVNDLLEATRKLRTIRYRAEEALAIHPSARTEPLHDATLTARVEEILVEAVEWIIVLQIKMRLMDKNLDLQQPYVFAAEFERDLPTKAVLKARAIRAAMRGADRLDEIMVARSEGAFYRVPRRKGLRLIAYASPLIDLLVGAGLLAAAGWVITDKHLLDVQLKVGVGAKELLIAYGAMLVGVTVHLLVESSKQMQSHKGTLLPISNPRKWLLVRWPGLAISVLWMVVTAIALYLANAIPAETGMKTLGIFFAAGYSLNSVIGLWTTRFDAVAAKGLTQLTATIAPTAADSAKH